MYIYGSIMGYMCILSWLSPSLSPSLSLSLSLSPPEPKTPVDPCDRVKFILGAEDVDSASTCRVSAADASAPPTTHSIFTELEELKYDHHGNKYVRGKEGGRLKYS